VLLVGIKQAPDHSLVLRIVLLRFALEKLDAALTQRDRDLDPFVPKNEVLGSRQKIRDDLEVSEGFIRVPNFLARRFAFLCASNQLRRCKADRQEAARLDK